MTRIKDPKQVANSIRHIRLILSSSLRVCFMAGRCSLCAGAEGPGGSVGGSGALWLLVLMRIVRRSIELNAYNAERTTAPPGGWGTRK